MSLLIGNSANLPGMGKCLIIPPFSYLVLFAIYLLSSTVWCYPNDSFQNIYLRSFELWYLLICAATFGSDLLLLCHVIERLDQFFLCHAIECSDQFSNNIAWMLFFVYSNDEMIYMQVISLYVQGYTFLCNARSMNFILKQCGIEAFIISSHHLYIRYIFNYVFWQGYSVGSLNWIDVICR
jgi:hypothetical protein